MAQHAFEVRDSIAMATFGEPSASTREGGSVQRSPNGRYFLVVTSRGIIQSNQVESTLWLFEAQAIRRYLNSGKGRQAKGASPRVLAKIVSIPRITVYEPHAPLISDIRWSSDSKAVYFLGANSRGARDLYESEIGSGQVQLLSRRGYDVRQFDLARGAIAYTAIPSGGSKQPVPWDEAAAVNADAGPVTGLRLQDILFPQYRLAFGVPKPVPDLWLRNHGVSRRVDHFGDSLTSRDTGYFDKVLSLSPDGRTVIRLLPVLEAETSWTWYDPKPGYASWRIDPRDASYTSPTNLYRLREYELIDTKTGKTKTLIHGPSGISLAESDRSEAVWSREGKRVLLGNVALPLDDVEADEKVRRRRSCAVASVDLPSLAVHCIVFTRDGSGIAPGGHPGAERLKDASFGATADEAVIRLSSGSQQDEVEYYAYEDGRWSLIGTRNGKNLVKNGSGSQYGGSPSGLGLTIKQGLNEPPKLWATDIASGKEKLLWNPNPQLDRMKFGKATVYRWNDPGGYAWSGILIMPPDYVSGRRYPLVIQPHGVPSDDFITDGKYSTAMAARPLASAGFMVLQMPYRADHIGTQREALDQIDGYQSVIAQLSAAGLIDARRVGIVGFSRTCWHVEESLVNRPTIFAAATLADGIDHSYMQYRLFGEENGAFGKEIERVIGAKPIGEGLQRWLALAPSFHADRVITPLRIEAIGPASVLMEWELYASLRQQAKPVDIIYIPYGQHILQKPLDRLASQQGNVDWFRFWLQGYEDPDPAKSEQYRRWRRLRSNHSVRYSETAGPS
jgi:dipeptidyl aminopeptidase/acylaminoacyl peptidase